MKVLTYLLMIYIVWLFIKPEAPVQVNPLDRYIHNQIMYTEIARTIVSQEDSSWITYLERARPRAEADSLANIARQDTARYQQFLDCTDLPDNGGDAGCDSCFTAIFGYSLEFK